jgi:MFS family permease
MSTTPEPRPNWGRRIWLTVGAVTGMLVLGLVASVTIPRWWAQRIGDQVDGSITQGILVGLFYGFLFTVLPIVVLGVVLRWRRGIKAIALGALVALLLASPNLMTLGIVIGRGNAAHAGDRTLDVDAPAFRGASLAGALLALALVGYVGYLLASRRRARGPTTRVPYEKAETKGREG